MLAASVPSGRPGVAGLSQLASAQRWLSFYERFWTDRLDVLERLLRDDEPGEPTTSNGDDQ